VALIGLISTVIRTLDETMELKKWNKSGRKMEEKWKKKQQQNERFEMDLL